MNIIFSLSIFYAWYPLTYLYLHVHYHILAYLLDVPKRKKKNRTIVLDLRNHVTRLELFSPIWFLWTTRLVSQACAVGEILFFGGY